MSPTEASPGFGSFEVEIYRPPATGLGLHVLVVSLPSHVGLLVERVTEGEVMDTWNRRTCESVNVLPGDFIVSVNGVGGGAGAIADELRRAARLRIVVHRRTYRCRGPGGDPMVDGAASQATAAPEQPPPPGPEASDAPPMRPPAAAAAALVARQREQLRQQEHQQLQREHQRLRQLEHQQLHREHQQLRQLEQQLQQQQQQQQQRPRQQRPQQASPPQNAPSSPAADVQSAAPPFPRERPGQSDPAFWFDVEVSLRPGQRLGLELEMQCEASSELVISCVLEGGLIERWNQERSPPFRVQPGDCIHQVNGIGGMDVVKMALEFAVEHQALRFTIKRRRALAPPLPTEDSPQPPSVMPAFLQRA